MRWATTTDRTRQRFYKGNIVNKSELIDAIAASADIPKAAAGRALDATLEAVTEALQRGESVALVGFGTFATKERAARTGRNPQTGNPIDIAAATLPTFKPGKALKDAVNK
ncbi:HU family DNA-binding protein [Marinobacterium marinum]|uniref:HU family DNA-binding protein n=1 Tax=Marinobacterium marinum TaxID=2756129 RepID=A0A7W1WXN7_9GAMM|nr:HU family DNA-binding protein [Marinobacterium marinum]MBA4501996.1 HU family DNA-binding protein [Marinobacterium marinum]